jgi:hypothetical protein
VNLTSRWSSLDPLHDPKHPVISYDNLNGLNLSDGSSSNPVIENILSLKKLLHK